MTKRLPVRRPRIAVSGSAGVGKTTLAHALADRLDLPLVPEGMRQRLEAGLDLHALDRDAFKHVLIELLDEIIEHSADAMAVAGGFVGDRSTFDVAAFWLYYGFGNDADASDAVVGRVKASAFLYDTVIVLPWGAIPLQDDGVRSTNPWLQLHYQTVIEGVLARWATSTVLLPEDCISLERRIEAVRTALAKNERVQRRP